MDIQIPTFDEVVKENFSLLEINAELLKALEHARHYMIYWKNNWDEKYPGIWNGNYFDALSQVDAAIAKAKGETK